MPTINEALQQFLTEIGPGNPRSSSSPVSIADWFAEYLNSYAHENLNKLDLERFHREYREDHRFCDIFSADRIEPYHLNSFINTFLTRKVMATRSMLKACGPWIEKLAQWLAEQSHWKPATLEVFRELVGDKAGAEMPDSETLATALREHVEYRLTPRVPKNLPDEDYVDGEFKIVKVEPGKLHLESLSDDEQRVLALPKAVTAKAKAGRSVSLHWQESEASGTSSAWEVCQLKSLAGCPNESHQQRNEARGPFPTLFPFD